MPDTTQLLGEHERTIGNVHLHLSIHGLPFACTRSELDTVYAIIEAFKDCAKPGRPRKAKADAGDKAGK